jgi:hypothetical protein
MVYLIAWTRWASAIQRNFGQIIPRFGATHGVGVILPRKRDLPKLLNDEARFRGYFWNDLNQTKRD